MSAYAQLDRTGQGYVRIPDLARASGLPMADVREVLIDLSDRGAAYLTPADEPRNAHSHLIALLLGSQLSVPIVGGRLGRGRYQSVMLVELDGPRPRQVLVQLLSTQN
jgi:thiamine phosphate synthase YjbQ (UPF0047 family)